MIDDGIAIQSVAFGSGAVEVSYMESHANEGPIGEYRTLVIPVALVEDELAEVLDDIQQLVDRALVLRRNPPERVRR